MYFPDNMTWQYFFLDTYPGYFLQLLPLALGLDFGAENLFNLLLFLPFGFLYPLFRREATWRRTALTGLGLCLGIELLQPVFGRSFDLNDVLLNGIGIAASTALCFGLRRWWGKEKLC